MSSRRKARPSADSPISNAFKTGGLSLRKRVRESRRRTAEAQILFDGAIGHATKPPFDAKLLEKLPIIKSVENLIFAILRSCYFHGGILSPTLPWTLTIPLLALYN